MTTWHKLPPNPNYPAVLELWAKGDHWVTRTPFGVTAYWFEGQPGERVLRWEEVGAIEEGKALVDEKTEE